MGESAPRRTRRGRWSKPFGDRVITVALGVVLAVSVVGLTLMVSWLNLGAPDGFVRPFASAVWLATLSAFFAADAILSVWHIRRAWSCACCTSALETKIYIAVTGLELCSVLAYALAGRWDAFGWGLVLATVFGLNAVASARRLQRGGTPPTSSAYSVVPLDEAEQSINQDGSSDGDGNTANGGPSRPWRGGTPGCTICRVANIVRGFLWIAAVVCTVLLFGGAVWEAQGYLRYRPEGTFVTVTHESGMQQRVLAQCVTPPGYVAGTYPTFWSEVGGGGHSMSDLWGLRDELVDTYGVRYCSYDMPGTGWSQPSVELEFYDGEQVSLTEHIMEELGEKGPFVMMGSMDNAFDRALNFALFHEDVVEAVVPVTLLPDEFQMWKQFYGKSDSEMVAHAETVLSGRALFGNIVTFFPINWGISSLFIPASPDYVPRDKAEESAFLNVQNEKQWCTNIAAIMQQLEEPDLGLTDPPYFGSHAADLNKSIPIYIFGLGRNASQLTAQCKSQGLEPDSEGCRLANFTYHKGIAYNQQIADANKGVNKLFLCGDECADTSNAFLINQGSHIKWFAKTMMSALHIPPLSQRTGDRVPPVPPVLDDVVVSERAVV
mmetsp:Transcript_19815/g.51582  ORF Transcript_19815/g.51582 Transcript_19815/m.51582 type:complete len:606 (-) Transcript_19815:177-1994(-)